MGAQGRGAADTKAGQRGNTTLPYWRAPVSFKRMLGTRMAPELDDTSEDPVKDENEDEDCEECSNALPRNSPLERLQPAQCALRPVIRGLGICRCVLPLLQARVVPPHEQPDADTKRAMERDLFMASPTGGCLTDRA